MNNFRQRVEIYSWLFVHKEWEKRGRMPLPDKGFEQSFRQYIYEKIDPDVKSNTHNTGLGISLSSFSGVPHELDVICSKGRQIFVFEVKHYSESRITKEMIFTFLGKVLDFYFRSAPILSNYEIIMYFVTTNQHLEDSIRKLCLAYGIKLIEPSLMTLAVLNHFARDLYQKTEEKEQIKSEIEMLIEDIDALCKSFDYSFSEIFIYKNGKIEINEFINDLDVNGGLKQIKELNWRFREVHEKWKLQRN